MESVQTKSNNLLGTDPATIQTGVVVAVFSAKAHVVIAGIL